MLLHESYADIPVPGSAGTMRVHLYRPAWAGAINTSPKFPAVMVFTEIYQVETSNAIIENIIHLAEVFEVLMLQSRRMHAFTTLCLLSILFFSSSTLQWSCTTYKVCCNTSN
jgi:hypothetical protein